MAKVSVIVTCHNLETYLGECLDSIKAQIEYPHEIIIVHDGCEKFMTEKGATNIILTENRGVCNARMVGAKVSTGDYLLFVDADDKMPEIYIHELVKKIKKGNEIVYPDCILWSSWGNSGMKNCYQQMPHKITWQLLVKQNWVLVTSLIPRELFLRLGGFHVYPIFEDWEFFQRAFLHKTPFVKADTWLSYRQRTASRNRQSDELKIEITNKIKEDIQIYIKKYIKP